METIFYLEIKMTAETNKTQMNFYGQVANVAQTVTGDQKTIQHNYAPEQKQNLVEAISEINKILREVENSYSSNTNTEQDTIITETMRRIDQDKTLKARLISTLKAASKETLKEVIDNPLINVLIASLEGWQNSQ